MARTEHNELKAGIVTLIALGAGVAVLIWLGVTDVLRQGEGKAYFYAREIEGPLGLNIGSQLLLNDAEIGKIIEIRPDVENKRTIYVARIDRKGISIHATGEAQVAAGMVGAARLAIRRRGTDPAPLADEEHPIEISPSSMSQTLNNLAVATGTVKDITLTLKQQLNAEDDTALLAKIHRIIDSLQLAMQATVTLATNLALETSPDNRASMVAKSRAILDRVNAIATDAGPKISRTLSSVEGMTTKVDAYINKDVAEILAGLRTVNTELINIMADIRVLTSKARDVIVLNRENLDAIILDLRSMSANLSAGAKEIRRNPWRLLEKPSPEQTRSQNIYDAARSYSEGASQLNTALAKLSALREARPRGVEAQDPDLARILDHLKVSFEKFRNVEDALWEELK